MKFKTIREGEQAVVFNHLGEGELLVGPKRIFLFRQRIQKLTSYTASLYEYLIVKYNSGEVVHVRGPCEIFKNPLEHSEIKVQKGVQIDSNHILVVYNKRKDGSVERRVVQGPTLFVPTAEEWLHKFSWHGEDKNELGRMIPGLEVFTEVACVPGHFYYNVKEVRTNDDTRLQVHLMIFYELKDVIKMLEATHDPIADMINAVCADVIAFSGKLSFADFLVNCHKLSSLDNYPELQQRVDRIGYSVSKVVYRGYKASDQLQLMQDKAIQSRTQLRLNAELQEQRQKLTDFKLQKEKGRTEMKNSMEKNKTDHRQKVEKLKQQHELTQKQNKQDVQLQIQTIEENARLECARNRSAQDSEFLQRLKTLDVNLTMYLVNRNGAPVDKEYRVSSEGPIAQKNYPQEAQDTLKEFPDISSKLDKRSTVL